MLRWKIAEVQMDNCRASGGVLQRFRWSFAEVQMEFCRGSDGHLQRFRWTLQRFGWTNAEVQMEFFTDLDGQLQRFKQTYAKVQMDFIEVLQLLWKFHFSTSPPSQRKVNNDLPNLILLKDDIYNYFHEIRNNL